MTDDNLQAVLDLAGVNAAMVFDDAGRLVAQRGKAIYDRALCEQVGAMLAKAIDSIALHQPDWESATAQYADGTILMRNVGSVLGVGYVMAVVADSSLNPAFATVALRVASNKAKRAIEQGQGLASPASSSSAALPASTSAPPQASSSQTLGAAPPPASGSRPMLATSGLSWSQTGASGISSKVMTADPASAAYLARCAKTLALYVGPMAKIFVEEAVRRVCQDAPYSMARAKPLAEDLAGQIDDTKERSAFLKAMEATDAAKAGPSATLTTYATRSAVLFRPRLYNDEILPAYKAFINTRERILLKELLERARPLAAKARSGLGPNLIIQSELADALKKLGSEATAPGDMDRLAKVTLVPGLVDLLCVPWERGHVPVQRTWGCPLAEYLEAQSPWITDHLLRGVPSGTEFKLPSGVPIRFCAPEEAERIRKELALVPRPPAEAAQREYDTLLAILETVTRDSDLVLALWSR